MENKICLVLILICSISIINCKLASELYVEINDPDIKKVYLYKDLYLKNVQDSSSKINDRFSFKLNFKDSDIFFISDKTPSEINMGKYFGQFMYYKGEKITVKLLPKLKYDIDGKSNVELKAIYDNHDKFMRDSSYMRKAILDHSNDPISPFLLYLLMVPEAIDNSQFFEFKNLIDTKILLSTYYGLEIIKISESLLRKELPEKIILVDRNGNEKLLSTTSGKITFIDNWASWCIPCLKEMPEIIKIYQELSSTNIVKFIAISSDEDTVRWINSSIKTKIPFESYILHENFRKEYMDYYRINAIPYGILLDENGSIISSGIKSASELKSELKKIGIQ